MKKFLNLVFVISLCTIFTSCNSTVIIEDTEQFSKITEEELKTIMGEPTHEYTSMEETSKGNFELTTLS